MKNFAMSLKVPYESLGTVSYSHSTVSMAVSLAVSSRYANVTDKHPATAWQQSPRSCMASRGNKPS